MCPGGRQPPWDSSRFAVSLCRPALSHCGPAGTTPTLRVFALWRTYRDEARVAGMRAERLGRIRRSRLPRPGSRFDAHSGSQDMAATRRPLARGDRTPPSTVQLGCGRGNRLRHAAGGSDHSSAFARASARSPAGYSPNAPFSRGVPLPVRPKRGLAGRRRSSLVRRPTALMGFKYPSQVCSRGRVDDFRRWTRVTSDAAKWSRVLRVTV
jgi:hypothetical protein